MDGASQYDCTQEATVHALYKKLGPAALGKALRLVGRHDIAQELVHDVFVRLWQRRLSFDSEKQAFLWIYKACHHAAIDYLRSTSRRHHREASYQGEEPATAPPPCFAGMRPFLAEVLASLPELTAQILVYREVDGMTQEEIAELLGISRKTVQRTMDRLARRFAALGDLEGPHAP